MGTTTRALSALFVLALAAGTALAQDGYLTDFESNTADWVIQSNNTTYIWKIDQAPALFTSPQTTLNNSDDASVDTTSGQPTSTAFSPTINFSQPGSRIIQFFCYRSLDLDWDNPGGCGAAGVADGTASYPSRKMNWGVNLFTGSAKLKFAFFTQGGTVDPVTDTLDVQCPNNEWHQHDIRVVAGAPNILFIDGANIMTDTVDNDGNGTVDDEAIYQVDIDDLEDDFAHQLAFTMEWQYHVGSDTCAEDHDVSFWAIDDLSFLASDENPFGPDPTIPGTGGTGGGSEGCFHSGVFVPPPGSDGGPGGGAALLLAIAAVAYLLRRTLGVRGATSR